ncbi:hypothetical protein BBJ28_00020701 [Nothophytophthora sp. Chile5]|nr:hypothetical protein BBJ28_00020701 [Nothophytophthora sp. Chile5]
MGQTTSIQEDKMKKRIRQAMGTFMDFGKHLNNANEWCVPRLWKLRSQFAFAVAGESPQLASEAGEDDELTRNAVVDVMVLVVQGAHLYDAKELLPLLNLGDNFTVEVPRDRTYEAESSETIGQAKTLTVAQFYYIYCFLSDCQICMDKQKQVVLPCTHSFCLTCFQHWSTQSQTCPICRAKFNCSEGDELWQLTSDEVDDIGSYATDLVARIYEYLDKRERSPHSIEDIKRSAEQYTAAIAVKQTPFCKFVHTDLFPTALPLGFPSIMRTGIRLATEFDSDLMLALELASGEDQYAAVQHFEQLQRDQMMAVTMAMQADTEESPDES